MTQPLAKGILFDMDNTILAFDATAAISWQKICQRFASHVQGLQSDKLHAEIEDTRALYWSDPESTRRGRLDVPTARREIVSIALRRVGIDNPTLAGEIADSYDAERMAVLVPFPGAIDALKHFRGQGVKMALVTNGGSEHQRRSIERFGLAPLFDYVLIEGEFGYGKPDERVFRGALDHLRVTTSEAWMVGDDLERDVAGSQRLGIFGVWADWKNEGLPEKSSVRPDRIIHTLSDLVQVDI